MTKPKTIAITRAEGEEWWPFPHPSIRAVHAIKFDDGSVWDAINGWRRVTYDASAHTSEMNDAAEVARIIADD